MGFIQYFLADLFSIKIHEIFTEPNKGNTFNRIMNQHDRADLFNFVKCLDIFKRVGEQNL